MPIEAVIFDMDGVIVDSEEYWWQSRVEFAGKRGKQWTFDDQRTAMGRSTVEWARVMQERLHLEDMPLDDIMREVIGGVNARLKVKLPVLPGAIEAVRASAAAYPVALASGSPTSVIQEVMKLTGLDQVFKLMIYGDDMHRGKPDPEIYLTTAQKLGFYPEHCVGIEDSGNGLRALKAAGMRAIAVPSPGFPLSDDLLAQADIVLKSLSDFSIDMLEILP
ncbi:MAG TPA: HAD family phosphatase [Phototrophicaceae bacterium]|nr:HAD family phosphatase [Phototrophicaceae bacterium]